MPSDTNVDQTDLIFKALASKPRREILSLLARGVGAEDDRCCEADEVCACVFSERLGLGAPTVSHHMKILVESGLVTASKQGLWVYYRLNPAALEMLATQVRELSAACCARDPEAPSECCG